VKLCEADSSEGTATPRFPITSFSPIGSWKLGFDASVQHPLPFEKTTNRGMWRMSKPVDRPQRRRALFATIAALASTSLAKVILSPAAEVAELPRLSEDDPAARLLRAIIATQRRPTESTSLALRHGTSSVTTADSFRPTAASGGLARYFPEEQCARAAGACRGKRSPANRRNPASESAHCIPGRAGRRVPLPFADHAQRWPPGLGGGAIW
jgi:hypothetical protein